MINFIIVSDLHLSNATPVNRRDDYWQTGLEELEWIFKHAATESCECILCTGDVLDKPDIPKSCEIELIKLFRKYSEIRFITTIGNHDVIGNSLDTYKNHSLGLLEESIPNFTVLNRGDCNSVGKDGEIEIASYPFGDIWTEELLNGTQKADNCWIFQIGLVHATVGPDDAMSRWQSISSQSPKWGDVICLGDIHDPFYQHQFKNGPLALHPGSIGRRNISDRHRTPNICLLCVQGNKEFNYEFIEVPSNAIFADIVETCEENVSLAEEFLQQWNQIALEADASPIDRLKRVSSELGYSKESLDLTIGILQTL